MLWIFKSNHHEKKGIFRCKKNKIKRRKKNAVAKTQIQGGRNLKKKP